MERLTIQEIIEHCKRKTDMYEKIIAADDLNTVSMTNSVKEYWEHKQVAEYLEELLEYRKLKEQGKILEWIPVEEQLPDPDRYILVSFENFSMAMAGRYTVDDDDGGTFRIGDEDDSFSQYDLYVNAWMYLPKHYESQVTE